MKLNQFKQRMNKPMMVMTSIAAAVMVAACGGGGGGGIAGSGSSAVLSGLAVDGYLQGSSVFLDLNSNGVLDSGEPSTTTDTSGRYSLDFSGVTGSVTGLPIVVRGGTDSDTGLAFAGQLKARADVAAHRRRSAGAGDPSAQRLIAPDLQEPATHQRGDEQTQMGATCGRRHRGGDRRRGRRHGRSNRIAAGGPAHRGR